MTAPLTPEALVEALAQHLAEAHVRGTDREDDFDWSAVTDQAFRASFIRAARRIFGGPLAPLLAAHQQVTAERDEARAKLLEFGEMYEREDKRIAAEFDTANAALARLRAEGEAKDRALKVALDAYDAAVRESANAEAIRQDVLGRQGDHPDIGEIMDQVGAEEGCMRATAAQGIARADLVAAVRTALARAATAREGA